MRLFLFLVCAVGVMHDLKAADMAPACFHDLEINFFESKAVMEAFSLHNVPQNTWAPIVRALQVESQRVPEMVRAQARQMSPNPFDPFDAKAAMDVLHNSLYDVFVQVLTSYNFNQALQISQSDMMAMFNYISNKQAYRIERCFGRLTPDTARNPNQSTNSNIIPESGRGFEPYRPVEPSYIEQSPRSAPSPRAPNALPNPFGQGYYPQR